MQMRLVVTLVGIALVGCECPGTVNRPIPMTVLSVAPTNVEIPVTTVFTVKFSQGLDCLLYTSPSPRD